MENIENYLERARKERDMQERNGAYGVVEAIERIFPELVVSGEEKIKVDMINYLANQLTGTICQPPSAEDFKEWIAWLEKHKSVEWSKEDTKRKENCIHFLELQKKHHAGTFEIEDCISWLESLRPQNHWNPTEQNHVWSEEDEGFVSRITTDLENCECEWGSDKQEEKDWLKSLKDRYAWKPSEQQLYDMEYIMAHYPNIRGMVESIYNELKKL